jgi:hypothetical protein
VTTKRSTAKTLLQQHLDEAKAELNALDIAYQRDRALIEAKVDGLRVAINIVSPHKRTREGSVLDGTSKRVTERGISLGGDRVNRVLSAIGALNGARFQFATLCQRLPDMAPGTISSILHDLVASGLVIGTPSSTNRARYIYHAADVSRKAVSQ